MLKEKRTLMIQLSQKLNIWVIQTYLSYCKTSFHCPDLIDKLLGDQQKSNETNVPKWLEGRRKR
jgi:hypothetical protein